jgi:hypothetical protein
LAERISFRTVCLGNGPNLPQRREYRNHEYSVEKRDRCYISSVKRRHDGVENARIEQPRFDPIELQGSSAYQKLTPEQRARLLALYNDCNPRPVADLLAGTSDPIVAGDIEFKCSDDALFSALIDVLYALRNALLHGELHPDGQAFQTYEHAYRIVTRFLECLRN